MQHEQGGPDENLDDYFYHHCRIECFGINTDHRGPTPERSAAGAGDSTGTGTTAWGHRTPHHGKDDKSWGIIP